MKQSDAESLAQPSQQVSVKRKREKRPPLWWRITFEEHMVALVRLLGHEGVPVRNLRETAKPLLEKYGRERMQAAADEITECVGDGDDTVVRLTEQARKLAVHLIGPLRPGDTTATGDSTPAPLAPIPIPSHSEADASAIPEVADESEEAETSDPKAAAQLEAEHRDWVNFETQCIYQFLTRDRDFIDECRHLVVICRKRATSGQRATTSDEEEEMTHEASLLAAELERFVQEFNPLGDDTTPFAALLDAALGNVDWYALAESFVEYDGQNGNPP